MKKKLLLLTAGLSILSAGSFLAGRTIIKHWKNRVVNKDREKLESYVEKYLNGNDDLMAFIGTLSDDQVKELLGILSSIQHEQSQLKLKSPVFPKYLEKKVTNLIS